MSKYVIRLDDAADLMDVARWQRMESLLDDYNIKPLVGIIPLCKDPKMEKYIKDDLFWKRVNCWKAKGWSIAIHGYNHVYVTQDGGINPVQLRSEFAGEPFDEQAKKIQAAFNVMKMHGIQPRVFFAPSHTFDMYTIEALKKYTDIRIISDTIASKPYKKYGITFVPVQTGKPRKLPMHTITIAYHPNQMTETSFVELEDFIRKNRNDIINFPETTVDTLESVYDIILRKMYFLLKKIKRKLG